MKAIILLTAALFYNLSASSQCALPDTGFTDCEFQAIGHRGYSMYYPENTLSSLREAFKRGVRICEVDVSLTADDKYVLFHDRFALHRTTNGTGRIDDLTLAQLQLLDAGSWKGPGFAGEKIPTLAEALAVAEKFDGILYLDVKDYRPDLMKEALEVSGADAHRLMPSLTTINEAIQFRTLLPNTPWVWYYGGLFPADVSDQTFYTRCMDLGCYAFEISGDLVGTDLWAEFRDNVHAAGGKTWAFTVNGNELARQHVDLGVDGLETDRPWELMRYICNDEELVQQDNTTANWRFQGSLASAGIGPQLRMVRYEDAPILQRPVAGNTSAFGISPLDGSNDTVLYVPAQDTANGLFVYTNFDNRATGVTNDSYTVVMDILLDESSEGEWVALYQTDRSNKTDADLFINPAGGIGIIGEYFGSFQTNTWYRIAFTVDYPSGVMKLYQNGTLLGEITLFGTRWTVFNNGFSGEQQGFLLLADDGGETSPVYISALQLRDYVLTGQEILSLGGPDTVGIPTGNPDISRLEISGISANNIFTDWEDTAVYVMVPQGYNTSQVTATFSLYPGATSSIQSPATLDLSSGPYELTVNSEDGLKNKTWKICAVPYGNSISENNRPETLQLYPNPANDHVVAGNGLAGSRLLFRDVTGKLLLEKVIPADGLISTADLRNGLYIVEIHSGDGIKSSRLLINR